MAVNSASPPRASMRIRGRSFIALVLAPEPPIARWLTELDAQIQRSPAFFNDRPVIVDLSNLPGEGRNLDALIDSLQNRDIRIIGVEGADPSWAASETWGRTPLVSTGRPDRAMDPPPDRVPDAPPAPAMPSSLLLNQPVRSGQSVVYEHGDITVLGSVASGAEVVAAGSIHIYGTLRGRAIAGFMGRQDARIFCRRLEAELLAISGIYSTADTLAPGLRGRAVQAWLDGDTVKMAALD